MKDMLQPMNNLTSSSKSLTKKATVMSMVSMAMVMRAMGRKITLLRHLQRKRKSSKKTIMTSMTVLTGLTT